ncbi:protein NONRESPONDING TO OXYLIPINS 2, mitochondrial isoform X1 [Daucus carota subsp. sativus]|uniref:protein NONRESPONDING TO OXYLIPINS 2, mitochondrial isoform X1 n=1 Tax=Daucus carota subsp. sativus TaxID=79200 RepID=UPI0007EFFD73|nr:PREDICTED: uncharacterized protein LOC108210059 [Daucus carota subsp. sativus]
MASKCCSRLLTRSSTSFLKSAFKSTSSASAAASSAKSSKSTPLRRFSLSRIPSELGAVQSMMPLHSAVAAARMTSCLSTASRSCRALSQELGLSVPR